MKIIFHFSNFQVPSTNRNHRLNRGRMNGHTNTVGKAHTGVYIPQLQQYYQMMDYLTGLLLFLQKFKTPCTTLFVFGIFLTAMIYVIFYSLAAKIPGMLMERQFLRK